MTEWLDISTAPKERILATDGDVVSVAYWDRTWSQWACEAEATVEYGCPAHDHWEPTHWMPLPKAPAHDGTV